MSESMGSDKKWRVAPSDAKSSALSAASSVPGLVNSLRLVQARNLPLAIELDILDCLDFVSLCELLFLSKDMHELCRQFFAQMRQVRAHRRIWSYQDDSIPTGLPGLKFLRHCARLQRSVVFSPEAELREPLHALLTELVHRNAASLTEFDSDSTSRAMMQALAGCTRLERWRDADRLRQDLQAADYATLLVAVFASNPIRQATLSPIIGLGMLIAYSR